MKTEGEGSEWEIDGVDGGAVGWEDEKKES